MSSPEVGSNNGNESNVGEEENRGGVQSDDEEGGPSVAPRRKKGAASSETRQLKRATKALQNAITKMHGLGGAEFICVFLSKSGDLTSSSSPRFSPWVHKKGPGGMMHAFENLPTKRSKTIPVLSSFNDAFRLLNKDEVIFLLTGLEWTVFQRRVLNLPARFQELKGTRAYIGSGEKKDTDFDMLVSLSAWQHASDTTSDGATPPPFCLIFRVNLLVESVGVMFLFRLIF